jgi:hypothetical protein
MAYRFRRRETLRHVRRSIPVGGESPGLPPSDAVRTSCAEAAPDPAWNATMKTHLPLCLALAALALGPAGALAQAPPPSTPPVPGAASQPGSGNPGPYNPNLNGNPQGASPPAAGPQTLSQPNPDSSVSPTPNPNLSDFCTEQQRQAQLCNPPPPDTGR